MDEVLLQFQMPELMVQLEYMLRVVIASILGLIIGIERKNRNQSAGIRTHAIVALGAALMMVVSKYGFADVEKADASRVAAQVVSGIGFLGAGVIFVRNNLVNGLTTAAGMWATAGVGMAMGAGMYVIGLLSALLMVIVQFAMHKITYFANVAAGGFIRLSIVQREGAVQDMARYLKSHKVDVVGTKINKNKKGEIKLEFDVVYPPGFDRDELRAKLVEMEDVIAVNE